MTSEADVSTPQGSHEPGNPGGEPGHQRTVGIVVNARPHDVPPGDISFEAVVALAFPVPPGPDVEYTVTYRRGAAQKAKGSLLPGGIVKVHEGMIFNVTATDKS